MTDYWESRFKSEGTMWKFEPSDSAKVALDLFSTHNIDKILIPGCGYGRNAKLFCDNGLNVTGIEISKSAIDLAKANGLSCKIHHGSVTSMPFDYNKYDGIFCYAVIHLLNKTERKTFLKSCFNQLNYGGIMIFIVTSKHSSMFGLGKFLSKDRFEVSKGLKVFFYDSESITKEFSKFGLTDYKEIEEPIKFMEGQDPIKLNFVICKKNKY